MLELTTIVRPLAFLALFALTCVPHTRADADAFDWGYAPMFGRGTYTLADGTELEVYRAAFAKRLRETGDGPGLRLLLPLAVGIHDPLSDDPEQSSEARLAAFSPGVELEFALGPRWTVKTSAQVGYGRELNDPDDDPTTAILAAFDVRSRLAFESTAGRPALISGLSWAGYDEDSGRRASLMRFRNALEFRIDTPSWQVRDQPMYLLPHVLLDRYYRPPGELSLGDADAPVPLDSEWQLGLAAGREGGFKIAFIEFDNVGIAYRFSEQSSGIRLYVNSIF